MRLAAIIIALFVPAARVHAGAVEVSFLDEPAAVQGTSDLLRAQGCKPKAISAFERAIARYGEHPPGFDRSKFPRKRSGFYSFSSAGKLVSALPHRLCDSTHPFEFNCFDAVILLAKDFIRAEVGPDELAGPLLPAFTWTNNLTYRTVAATARDAFGFSYPTWYTDVTEDIMGPSTDKTRMSLVAAFYCWHVLPSSVSSGDVTSGLFKVLQQDWTRRGLVFPRNMEVVLCHQVGLSDREAVTDHAGLLLHGHEHQVYLEKSGGSGPFVRLDFDDELDLRVWLGAYYTVSGQGVPLCSMPGTSGAGRLKAIDN
jgi:hypothetical protein